MAKATYERAQDGGGWCPVCRCFALFPARWGPIWKCRKCRSRIPESTLLELVIERIAELEVGRDPEEPIRSPGRRRDRSSRS